MSSVLVHTLIATTGEAAVAARPRILILRSCRLAQFLAAVVMARRRHPHAQIVALSHRGHRHLLRAAGADTVIETPGRRFGVLHVPPWTLARLRSEHFEEVVIPQMNADPGGHLNLYRLVLALGPSRIVIVPGDEPAQAFERAQFLPYVLQRADRLNAIMAFGVAVLLSWKRM